MKMVKTFTKTRHQRMMPPGKGGKEGNARAGPPGEGLGRGGGRGKRRPDRVRYEHNTAPHPSASLCSVPRHSKGGSPVTPPHPPAPGRGREKRIDLTNTTGKTMECVKKGRWWADTCERATPPREVPCQCHPLKYLHRGQRASLT